MLKKLEREKILKTYRAMSDKDLIKEFWDKVYGSLGSVADMMIERDYDSVDIKEQRKLETAIADCATLTEKVLNERGIDPWKDNII